MAQSERPPKRSRLSLQVPKRVGGEVRLATPPPVVMVNGQTAETSQAPALHERSISSSSSSTIPVDFPTALNATKKQAVVRFKDPNDHTNMGEVEGIFMHELLTADWFDPSGNPIPPCGFDEATGIVSTVMTNLREQSVSKEAFLINLAALVGKKVLNARPMRLTRFDMDDRCRYKGDWEMRYGDIRGVYNMEETVLYETWKKPPPEEDGDADDNVPVEEQTVEYWQKRHQRLYERYRKKDTQLTDLRHKVIKVLKDVRGQELKGAESLEKMS